MLQYKCNISQVIFCTSHFTYHISLVIFHMSHFTWKNSHGIFHISHIKWHYSHITFQKPNIIGQIQILRFIIHLPCHMHLVSQGTLLWYCGCQPFPGLPLPQATSHISLGSFRDRYYPPLRGREACQESRIRIYYYLKWNLDLMSQQISSLFISMFLFVLLSRWGDPTRLGNNVKWTLLYDSL